MKGAVLPWMGRNFSDWCQCSALFSAARVTATSEWREESLRR
jgi:hypothetical protein